MFAQDQDDDKNCIALKEVTKRMYTRLQEMEKRHQEEKERLQVRNIINKYQEHLYN